MERLHTAIDVPSRPCHDLSSPPAAGATEAVGRPSHHRTKGLAHGHGVVKARCWCGGSGRGHASSCWLVTVPAAAAWGLANNALARLAALIVLWHLQKKKIK